MVSTIKLTKSFSKFMIQIPLFEKFSSQSFVTSIDVSQMAGHSSKRNKMRNINTIRRDTRNGAYKKWEINNIKIKLIAFVLNVR